MRFLIFFLLLSTELAAQSLSDVLTPYLQELPTKVQVNIAVESLKGRNQSFFHQADERIPAASVIKLPIMVEAMEWVKNGRLALDSLHLLLESEKVGGSGILHTYPPNSRVTYRELVTLMMTHSDNMATNILIRKLGMDQINQRIRAMGLSQSQLNRVMIDTAAVKRGIENYVTTREMNTILTKIYKKKLVTPSLCEQMIDILKQNKDTKAIASLLPATTAIAHKTGTLTYVRGDVGIVYARKPFVLSVFVRGTTTEEANLIIGRLAEICFKHFN
ncbi:serine hydrolase [Tellurirhabdus bombi]|uniref:serine hydrolase n=1 Tax=Tellurirhabdus bombi TaxID=2907205 RepID=UPI001F46E1FC|nr:serine hydrolase [Tellurirhabdus bombi]